MVDIVTNTDEDSLEDSLTIQAQTHELTMATMPYDDRLKHFLGLCNRRGSVYRPGFHQYPNLSQLSSYCECSVPTILRLATGKTRSPSIDILTIINAVACICPAAPHGDQAGERRARIADADRWVVSDPSSRGDIMGSLTAGIERRLRLRLN